MAAIEFIEKMDLKALKISEESYETFMEASIEEFNHHNRNHNHHNHQNQELEDENESSFNEKLDMAEAKAEELFIKAKEAFKSTGERANQAFSSFKESNLAKKSMEKFNKFIKDLSKESESTTEMQEDGRNEDGRKDDDGKDDESFETQLARAVSLSLLEDSVSIEFSDDLKDDDDEKEKEKEKDGDLKDDDVNGNVKDKLDDDGNENFIDNRVKDEEMIQNDDNNEA